MQGKLLSGPVGSRFVVGPFVKPYPIPLALVLIKQTSFESLSEVGFSDLLEFLSIALPDVNPFCHAPLTVTIIAPDGRSRTRPKQKTERGRRMGDKGPRAALGDGHLRSNAAFPSVSRQRDGGTWMTR